MKKYIAVFVAMVLVVGAYAQTISNVEVCNFTCLNPSVCVEVTDSRPAIVTARYLKAGDSCVVAGQLFWNASDAPCMEAPEEPVDYGAMWMDGRYYKHFWCLPIGGQVNATPTYRIIGVPNSFKQNSGKIWQILKGESVAFVFNKKGGLTGWQYNPSPTRKYPKNTIVVICHGSDNCELKP